MFYDVRAISTSGTITTVHGGLHQVLLPTTEISLHELQRSTVTIIQCPTPTLTYPQAHYNVLPYTTCFSNP
jgi:hypothetical protein